LVRIYINEGDSIVVTDTNNIKQKAVELLLSYDKHKSMPLWQDLDFLYFSTITISTVGYGDILPNSTIVRVVVIFEILLGQFLLVFFLSMTLSEVKKSFRGKNNNSSG